MIIKDATITRIDLDGKLNYYGNIPHIAVVKDDEITFIRLGDKNRRTITDVQLAEVETLQVRHIIDIEVKPIEWQIKDLSGTSYLYQTVDNVRIMHEGKKHISS